MGSLNKVMIIGNLGRDPEVRYTAGGQPVANFSVATNERWIDKSSGQPQERTEWHRVVVWGKQAESCGEYLAKGRLVYVEGRLQTREWNDKEGKKNFTTEVVANNVVFLGGRDGAANRRGSAPAEDFGPAPTDEGQAAGGPPPGKGGDNDIPF